MQHGIPDSTQGQAIVCPKCGSTQHNTFECHQCGVIFHTYKPRAAAAAPHADRGGHARRPRETASTYRTVGTWLVCAALTAAAVFLLQRWYVSRPVIHGPGIIAPGMPQQLNLSQTLPFQHKEYVITPLATFDIEARVLGVKTYRFDREADLAPYDVVFGWGPMSDETVLNQLRITQSNRFYYWWTQQFSIPHRAIEVHSANMHLIPADRNIARYLRKVRVGHVVAIKGFLVRADAHQWHWISSLTRQDTGAGACELIWVVDLVIR